MAAEFDGQLKKASGVPKKGICAVTTYKCVRYGNHQTKMHDMCMKSVFPDMSFWQPLGKISNPCWYFTFL
jgi:hypothetical protein